MSKNILKIIIIVVIMIAIIIGIMYLIDLDRMKKGEEVIFSTWGAKYAPVLNTNQNENNNIVDESYQKYSKTIGNIKLELNIPNEWKYKEMTENEDNDSYKYALKLYKNSEEQYAMLYFYNNQFGVCGTGRTSESIVLNNGKEAIIGYYDGNKNWSDISFYSTNKNIAIINYDLIDADADEVREFIKTINIIEDYNETGVNVDEQYEFVGTIIEASNNSIVVEPNEDTNERKSSDKISMKISRPTNGTNDFYVVGNKIKITYNGIIMESYPAQIVATKIELAN